VLQYWRERLVRLRGALPHLQARRDGLVAALASVNKAIDNLPVELEKAMLHVRYYEKRKKIEALEQKIMSQEKSLKRLKRIQVKKG